MIKRIVPFIALLLTLSACGLLREPEAPSGAIEAVPLEITPAPAAGEPAEEMEETATEPTDAPAATETAPAETASGGLRIYTISQADSQVRFVLDEELRGQPTTVVGTTDQVAGEIAFDLADLSTAQIGAIRINARTLVTDNNFRNRAIQNEILNTGQFEFITFTPTAINGLPGTVAVGEEVNFTIEGDLTIRDVTQPATFEVVATPVSVDRISGTARTIIMRETFNLTIPQVRNVANVEEQVELFIDFVAFAS